MDNPVPGSPSGFRYSPARNHLTSKVVPTSSVHTLSAQKGPRLPGAQRTASIRSASPLRTMLWASRARSKLGLDSLKDSLPY